MGPGRLQTVRLQAAPVEEPGDAARSGAGEDLGGTGELAIGRERRKAPDGGGDQMCRGGSMSSTAQVGLASLAGHRRGDTGRRRS